MRAIVAGGGRMDAALFRAQYVEFMTTPGSHNDAYASTCHRMFFHNLVHKKLPPEQCPDNDQHNVDTIDGLARDPATRLRHAISDSRREERDERAVCTHTSTTLSIFETGRLQVLPSVAALAAAVRGGPTQSSRSEARESAATTARRPRPGAVVVATRARKGYLGKVVVLEGRLTALADDSRIVSFQNVKLSLSFSLSLLSLSLSVSKEARLCVCVCREREREASVARFREREKDARGP